MWNKLSANEKNFMMLLCQKLRIYNKELNSANNNEAASQIERLKLLEGSILSGNISKEIIDEATSIIDDLADRSMLYRRTANALKKRFNSAFERVSNSFEQVQQLRRR